MVSSCGREGVDAIIEAAKRRFAESVHDKSAGSTDWWRVILKLFSFYSLFLVKEAIYFVNVVGLNYL